MENAIEDYFQFGVEIIELANSAYGLHLCQEWPDKAKLLKAVLSTSTFTRETLYPVYKKPFDILAKGSEFESWWALRDTLRTWVIKNAA